MLKKEIDAAIDSFLSNLKNPPVYETFEYHLNELSWKDDDSGKWRHYMGIYVIADEFNKLYIGRAYGTKFGARLSQHLDERKYLNAKEWMDVIRSPRSRVFFYSFNYPDGKYWIAALELYLIGVFAPKHNGKNG